MSVVSTEEEFSTGSELSQEVLDCVTQCQIIKSTVLNPQVDSIWYIPFLLERKTLAHPWSGAKIAESVSEALKILQNNCDAEEWAKILSIPIEDWSFLPTSHTSLSIWFEQFAIECADLIRVDPPSPNVFEIAKACITTLLQLDFIKCLKCSELIRNACDDADENFEVFYLGDSNVTTAVRDFCNIVILAPGLKSTPAQVLDAVKQVEIGTLEDNLTEILNSMIEGDGQQILGVIFETL